GGLDALYVEAGAPQASGTSQAGKPVTISASEEKPATDGLLFTISWDGESALALMFTPTQGVAPAKAVAPPASVVSPPPPAVGYVYAEDIATILDTTAEGILMFDDEGNVRAGNLNAEALFGDDGEHFLRRHLTDLFTPESQRAVAEYLQAVKRA